MKSILKMFLFITLFYFMLLTSAKADGCTYDIQAMMMQDASKIGIHYEETGTYLNVIIEGLNGSYYIKTTTTNLDGEDVRFQETIYGSSTTNKQTILWTNTKSISEVIFDVYGSNTTACPNYKLTSIRLTLPMYNTYSKDDKCKGNQDKYVCKEFVTNTITREEFDRAFQNKITIDVEDEKESTVKKEKESKVEKFFKENKAFIIAGSCLIVFGTITGVILYRRKNRLY